MCRFLGQKYFYIFCRGKRFFMESLGFDTDRYLQAQEAKIRGMLTTSADVLYIEFGGKLIQDRHSARVLPGYREDAKLELLHKLCNDGEVVFVVSAKDIVRGRIRGDFGTSYDEESIRTIQELKNRGLGIHHLVVSMLSPGKAIPPVIETFTKKIREYGIPTHYFFNLDSYTKARFAVGDLEINPYIPRRASMVLIVSPGGGSGKFGICLNQLFHEMRQGRVPDYLKFETFPVWNLPVKHPLNLAFMAASADFYDVVMRDKRHRSSTSYKRDIENYELLHILARHFKEEGKLLQSITSATHMGINMVSQGIVDDEVVQKEAAAEIARRLIRYKFEVARGQEDHRVLSRVRTILKML